MARIKVLFIALATLLPLSVAAETYLLMAEEDGCVWCERWREEIGPIYPKTAEGRTAPLLRYDLHSQTPDAILARRVHFTPTFILIEDNREVGRIEGYPGEDFFWGLLGQMFEQAKIPLDQTG